MSTFSRLIIAATIVLLPLVTTSGGIDNFREPKDSLLIAAAMAVLVLGALAFCLRPFTFRVTAEGRRAAILMTDPARRGRDRSSEPSAGSPDRPFSAAGSSDPSTGR